MLKNIIGYDHRFGRNRTADILDMKKFAKRVQFLKVRGNFQNKILKTLALVLQKLKLP